MTRILVTGASGYIALHVVDQLLKAGHTVRGTVRSLANEKKVEPIRKLAASAGAGSLELVEAELLDADSWQRAVVDQEIVIHVASPLPVTQVPDDEIIKPAVEGTLNVLRAALGAGVKRVVMTSSGLTITGYDYDDRTYSEADWADIDKMRMPYGKSKVLAERAAWSFVEERKRANEACFELAVIQPVFVLGPLLTSVTGTSATRFLSVFRGTASVVPNLHFPTCDVRDVALAHVRAAFVPEAVGHRHVIVSSQKMIPMQRWAEILSEEFAPKGYKIPSEFEAGKSKGANAIIDDTRMRHVLGIEPHDFKSTVIDMANSIIQQGIYNNN